MLHDSNVYSVSAGTHNEAVFHGDAFGVRVERHDLGFRFPACKKGTHHECNVKASLLCACTSLCARLETDILQKSRHKERAENQISQLRSR